MSFWKSLDAVVLVSLLFLIGCGKPANPPTKQSNGEELYNYHCAGCHGATGPSKGASSSAAVQDVVKNGKGTMRGFTDELSDKQIRAIGDYVMSLKK